MSKLVNICGHSFLSTRLPTDQEALVVDLGANNGDFSSEMIRRFRCRVEAAEPVPELYDRVRRMALPQLTIKNVAITGRSEACMTLNLYNSRCASLLSPLSSADAGTAVTVTSKSLGDFLRTAFDCEPSRSIDLLKVDIEGAELEMFEAAEDRLLNRILQISVEFHEFLFPETRERIIEIKRRFTGLGFSVIDFSKVNTDVLFLNPALRLGVLELLFLHCEKYRLGAGRILRRLRKTNVLVDH